MVRLSAEACAFAPFATRSAPPCRLRAERADSMPRARAARRPRRARPTRVHALLDRASRFVLFAAARDRVAPARRHMVPARAGAALAHGVRR